MRALTSLVISPPRFARNKWPDATDLHWFYNGPAHSFADYVIPLLRQIPNSQHSITNPLIDLLDQNKAFVESQFYVLHRIPMDEGRWIDQQCEGRYLDVFEKREGEWKIKHRQMCMESLREFVVNVENGGGVKVMHPMFGQRMPEDPVYLGVEVEGMKGLTGFEVDLWGAARARWAGGDREKIEEQGQQQGGKPAL